MSFQSSNYSLLENIRSGIGEWNSIIGNSMSNSLIVGYTNQDESRGARRTVFPLVDIWEGGQPYTSFGSEPFTPNNELRYNTFQLQDNFTQLQQQALADIWRQPRALRVGERVLPRVAERLRLQLAGGFLTDANGYLANPNRTTSPVTLSAIPGALHEHPRRGEADCSRSRCGTPARYAQDEWRPR